MNDRIEKLKERQAEELARALREEQIRAVLPMPVDFVYDHKTEVSVSVLRDRASYSGPPLPSLFEAVLMLACFGEPLECTDRKGTFRSIRPDEVRRERDSSSDPSIGTRRIFIEVDGGTEYGPTCKLNAWFRIGGRIMHVAVPFQPYEVRGLIPHAQRRGRGDNPRARIERWVWSGVGEDARVQWASGDFENKSYRSTYCWDTVESFAEFMRNHMPEPES